MRYKTHILAERKIFRIWLKTLGNCALWNRAFSSKLPVFHNNNNNDSNNNMIIIMGIMIIIVIIEALFFSLTMDLYIQMGICMYGYMMRCVLYVWLYAHVLCVCMYMGYVYIDMCAYVYIHMYGCICVCVCIDIHSYMGFIFLLNQPLNGRSVRIILICELN